jgi:aspartyl-tRNA synthetase
MTRPLLGAMRSHGCGTLRAGASGVVQVVVHPDQAQAPAIRAEDCVRVAGTVRARPAGNENPELPTGEVEVAAADTRCWPPPSHHPPGAGGAGLPGRSRPRT